MRKLTQIYLICLSKADLLQIGILFPHPFTFQRRFSNEKVGNRKYQAHVATFIKSVLKVEF